MPGLVSVLSTIAVGALIVSLSKNLISSYAIAPIVGLCIMVSLAVISGFCAGLLYYYNTRIEVKKCAVEVQNSLFTHTNSTTDTTNKSRLNLFEALLKAPS